MLRPRQLPTTVTRILLCDCLLYECTFIVIQSSGRHASINRVGWSRPISHCVRVGRKSAEIGKL